MQAKTEHKDGVRGHVVGGGEMQRRTELRGDRGQEQATVCRNENTSKRLGARGIQPVPVIGSTAGYEGLLEDDGGDHPIDRVRASRKT